MDTEPQPDKFDGFCPAPGQKQGQEIPTFYLLAWSKLRSKARRERGKLKLSIPETRSVLGVCFHVPSINGTWYKLIKEMESYGLLEFRPYSCVIILEACQGRES